MKSLFSILLLFTTSLYVLPVKEVIKTGHSVCMADVEDTKDETVKKVKVKDLISATHLPILSFDNYPVSAFSPETRLPASFHQVETPPPNRA